jgi:tartrate dehydratase alpha subunit/fumarate hydratase class I-like protein
MNSHGYIQVVDKSTFLSAGSLLDQVYVKENLRNNTENAVISVYYSDDDAVRIVIRN